MGDMTYGELRSSSSRVEEERPVKDFELAVSELIQMYRHRTDRQKVLDALTTQANLVAADDGWMDPSDNGGPETEEEDDTPPAA